LELMRRDLPAFAELLMQLAMCLMFPGRLLTQKYLLFITVTKDSFTDFI
jgi:hypothetical protein